MATLILDPATDRIASVPRSNRPFQKRQYRDKQFKGGEEAWRERLEKSSTVYVGNLSCYTNEYQLYELFTRCGSIKRIIMGLDKFKKTPCGFCFIEFDERSSALKSINYLRGTHLDNRGIQIDIDAGFEEGRQFGRGSSGGQVSDDRRKELEQSGAYQPNRSGYQVQATVLTRSITVVTCLALISLLLISCHPEQAGANIIMKPPLFGLGAFKFGLEKGRYLSPSRIKQAQLTDNRPQFEEELAQFLVNMMKAAKPTLMTAFIKATLADKKLKEIAIGLFFNATSSATDEERRR